MGQIRLRESSSVKKGQTIKSDRGDSAKIAKIKINNKEAKWFGTSDGSDTNDYVFLLRSKKGEII
jgi:ribosomal protein L2